MEDKLIKMSVDIKEKISACKTEEDIKSVKNRLMSKESEIGQLLSSIAKMSQEEKRIYGKRIQEVYKELQALVGNKELEIRKSFELIDVGLPTKKTSGFIHPISITEVEIKSILLSQGLTFETSPEIESDWNNFTALNIPEKHPTRDDQASFFLEGGMMLRTHTSSIQAHMLKKYQSDFSIFTIGNTYRVDNDRTHMPMFTQLECMVVNKDANMQSAVDFLARFLNSFFNQEIEFRLRPSYFPFTNFSVEIDILLNGKWLEVLGAGIIHPNVFRNSGFEPRLGFACGCGVERLHMIKYGINDIRALYNLDSRYVHAYGRRGYEIHS